MTGPYTFPTANSCAPSIRPRDCRWPRRVPGQCSARTRAPRGEGPIQQNLEGGPHTHGNGREREMPFALPMGEPRIYADCETRRVAQLYAALRHFPNFCFSPLFQHLAFGLFKNLPLPHFRRTLCAMPIGGNEAEWQTRKKRIDTKLHSLNPAWQIIPWHDGLDTSKLTCHAVTEFPTENGPADYALFVDGVFIGIIEAKKVTVNPQNVLEQAKRYSRGAANGPGNWNGFRVPFLYATNGEIIWHLDVRLEKLVSRTISNFHTASALEEKFTFDDTKSRKWLLDTPPERIVRLRPYQVASIVASESAMLAGKRELLIAMATGTGKTFLTVAQIYRLLESKKFRRILFLVDREALAAQDVRTFNAFDTTQGNKLTQEYEVYSQKFQKEDFGDDEPFDPKVLPNEYLTSPNSTHTFVYVSTIQRMARNLFGAEGCFVQSGGDTEAEADADKLDIPIHAFDLIIADECHRGYTMQETSLWRDTLNHFDAAKIGLTATPAPHTTALRS